LTLEAWVYPTALTNWRTILLKEKTNGLSYALYANTAANRPSGEISSSSNFVDTSGTVKLPLNVWSHVAVTYDGASLKLYINGTLASQKSTTIQIQTSNGSLRIGGNTVWGEYFKGIIDEVRLYNRALNTTEIQSDMNTPIP
jgi:hypothetical protein